MTHGARRPHGSFRRILLVSVAIAALVNAAHRLGYFDELEARWFDAMVKVFPATPTNRVVLVAITESDFADPGLFGAASPLRPAAVERLVTAIAAHRPRIVVLDLDLRPAPLEATAQAAHRVRLYRTLQRLSESDGTTWILPEVASIPWETSASDPTALAVWDSLRALAREERIHLRFGSPEIKIERGLARTMPLAHVSHGADFGGSSTAGSPTLFSLAVEEGARSITGIASPFHGDDSHHSMLIRYTGAFRLTDAKPVSLTAISSGDLLSQHAAEIGVTRLTGNVAVVGGTFEASRDFLWTSVGRMAAAEIWAEAIDTAFRGGGPRRVPTLLAFLIDVALGLGTALLMHRIGFVSGYALALAGFAVLTLLCSWASFALGFVFVNALPCFFGLRWEQTFGLLGDNRKLRQENEMLSAKNVRLE